MSNDKISVVSPGGKVVQVDKKAYHKARGKTFLDVIDEGEPLEIVEKPAADQILNNDAYVAAHGPAEPIRGRYMPGEEMHPALTRRAALGEEVHQEPAIAHGRFAVAEMKDATQAFNENTVAAIQEVLGDGDSNLDEPKTVVERVVGDPVMTGEQMQALRDAEVNRQELRRSNPTGPTGARARSATGQAVQLPLSPTGVTGPSGDQS